MWVVDMEAGSQWPYDDVHDEAGEEVFVLGPFDAAFLPINGACFRWRQPYSEVSAVLTPEQAVAAAVVLDARLVVPIHYGIIGAEGYEEVPSPEAALLEAAQKRKVGVEIVRPGEWVTWKPTKRP